MASNKSQSVPEDPYFWSVDELVYELCRNPQPIWASKANRALMPAAEVLEKALRDNNLDGESFMSMEIPDISNELGFPGFGTKRNLYKVITFLRSISREYSQQILPDQMMPYINGVESPQTTASHVSVLPQNLTYGNRTPLHTYVSPHYSNTPAPWQSFPQPYEYRQPMMESSLHMPSVPYIPPSNATSTATPKLQHATPSVQQVWAPLAQPGEDPANPPLLEQAEQKKKKRIAPTFVTQVTPERVAAFKNRRLPSDLARASREIGTEDYGKAAQPRLGTPDAGFMEEPDNEYEFVIAGSNKPSEERRRVGRAFRGHLRNYDKISRLGRDKSHRASINTRKDVIQPAARTSSEQISENPFLVEEQQPLDDGLTGIPNDLPEELRYLLKRYAPVDDDDGYPLFGESGDENDYDEKTWNEIDAEEEERKRLSLPAGVLTKAAINMAMDEAIAEMIVEWHERKLPKVRNKGFRLWTKATRKQSGAQYIYESKFWLDRFETAILKLRAAIAIDTWHNISDVKTQSRSLEESIFQREEHKYYLSVLHGDEPPTRADPLTLYRAKKLTRPEVPQGEEILDSESEHLSEDDFIEDDLSSGDSVPYGGPRTAPRPANTKTNGNFENPSSIIFEGDSDTMSAAAAASPAGTNEAADTIELAEIDDSDNEIWGSARRRLLPQPSSSVTRTPIKKHTMSRKLIEASDESEDEPDSDPDAARLLPKSQFQRAGTKDAPIEFMSSTPEPEDRSTSHGSVRTPSLNPGTESPRSTNRKHIHESSVTLKSVSSSSPTRPLNLTSSVDDGPKLEDVEAIRDLDWETITKEEYHRHAVAKAVYDLDPGFATKLSSYVEKVCIHPHRACQLLKESLLAYGDYDIVIASVAPRDKHLARCLGRLFLTYVTATSCMDEELLSDEDVDSAFNDAERGSRKFYAILRRVLKAFCSSSNFQKRQGKKRKSDEFNGPDETEDDSDILGMSEDLNQANLEVPVERSAKKRKKKVLQNQEAESQQADDRARVADQERVRAAMLRKLSQMDDNDDNDMMESSLHPVSFNPNAPTIYLDSHIGQKVKPHQENGIQFMWREITAGKGCMLAHTMGLGKTMQVISLLITIAQAAQSKDPKIQAQVPGNLRESRTLILCPPTLVDNWYDEILMWTPPGSLVLGDVRKVVSATKKSGRTHNIERWARDGGVLLMSYPLFKQIVEKRSRFIPEDLRDSYADTLTDLPSIVVADEAHAMKNPKSGLAKATKKFATKARIALTGSPLSNHLEEYHQMVDWVSPNYLGTLVQFKAKYSEPINEGLYSDSTSYERRTSSRKLMVLKRNLDPKICRADISAIAKDLPKKVEFFITVPLTTVQKDAYGKYVKHMLRDHNDGSTGSSQQAKMWAWLGVLSLLLNHPSAFVQKFSGTNKPEATTAEEEREESVDTEDYDVTAEVPADVPISSTGLSSTAIEDILSVFRTMTPDVLQDEKHSYRSVLTARIVEESMRVNEKVLIFSHSIPTLDYLEDMLENLRCTYARIDGGTSMSSRQDMVKGFNKQQEVQAMLISTRAGGLGLNLQGANRVIIYDFNFNPTWEEQAVGRAYRLGQQKHVFVYRFRAGGTFEETVYNMSIFKTQLFARVVDKRNPMRFASKKLSDYLFQPREVEQSELEECRGKDLEVLDRIMEQETCIRKVELTETFQVEEEDELTPEEIKQAEQEYQDEVLARTDPAELSRLQAKRRMATQQAHQHQQLSGRSAAIQPASSARFISTEYAPLPGDLRQRDFYSLPHGPSPFRPAAAHDDMEFDRPVLPSSRSASTGPGSIQRVDGNEDDDGKMECIPQ